MVLIGIDGGGSKTVALLAGPDGRVIGRGQGGASNYHSAGIDAAYAALDAAVAAAFSAAGLSASQTSAGQVRALCLGMAGVDRPGDRQVVQAWAESRFPGVPVQITNDAHLVLAAGTPNRWGLALISGTGSIAFGRDPAGAMARAGGWGYLMGDEGSGYAIGLDALRAVARAADDRGPTTLLTGLVLEHYALQQPQDLIGLIYRPETSRAMIARLAEPVETAAAAGDPAALHILNTAARELAQAAISVARQLNLSGAVPCALAGSVLVKGALLRSLLQSAVEAASTEAPSTEGPSTEAPAAETASPGLRLEPVTPVPEPALGAVRLAQELARPAD